MSTQTSDDASLDAILQIAIGHMAAKQLRAAVQVGLFRELVGGPRSTAELASATGTPERVVRILADAMNAMGLLERGEGRYANTPAAAAHLAGDASTVHDLAPLLDFFDDYSYPHWLGFDDTVRTGEPQPLDISGARFAPFLAGVMNYNALHGALLPRYFDVTGFTRMLDLGGLCEYFVIEALRANPTLTADVVCEADFAPAVERGIREAGFADRAVVSAGSAPDAPVKDDHDLVLLAHVIHRFGADDNARILRKAREAVGVGATLAVFDFVLDDDPRQRTLDALFAGEYLVIDGTTVYPITDVEDWLAGAGFALREVIALPGSPRLLVAVAV